MSPRPIVYETNVAPEWVDYNGHMRDAFYGLVFSYGIDALMVELGLDRSYRERTGGTIYVVELHQFFLAEASEGLPLQVAAQLLDADQKRLHLVFEMLHGTTGASLAWQESLQLHVVQDGAPRSVPFPAEIRTRVEAMLRAHRALPAPERRSAPIAIRRRC